MAKKSHRVTDYDLYDDDMYRQDFFQDTKERRKNKRMRNALRTRNIDDLMRDYDEY